MLSLRFTNHISDLKTCPSAGPSAWHTILHIAACLVHVSHQDLYLNVTSAEKPTMTKLSKIVLPVIFYLLILLFSSFLSFIYLFLFIYLFIYLFILLVGENIIFFLTLISTYLCHVYFLKNKSLSTDIKNKHVDTKGVRGGGGIN